MSRRNDKIMTGKIMKKSFYDFTVHDFVMGVGVQLQNMGSGE